MKENMSFNLINQTKSKVFYGVVLSLILLVCGTNQIYAASVSLSATPTAQTVTVGQTATYTIKINRDGYTDKVTLNAIGLPAGVTATFTPNTTTAISSTLKLQTSTNTPIGIFIINIKGTANAITIAPIIVKLTTKAIGSVSISVLPAAQQIIAGQSTFYDIAIRRTNFDGTVTLSAANVPSGVTVSFSPPTTNGNSSRMYLYSNGLPFAENSFLMNVSASPSGAGFTGDTKQIQMIVNCGIIWAKQFNTILETNLVRDFATVVNYDSAGNVYVAGHRDDNSQYGTANFLESWIAKFDAFGNRLWISPIQDGYLDYVDKPTDILVDSTGNVYVVGVRENEDEYSHKYSVIFVAKFDANGNLIRIHHGIWTFPNNFSDDGSRGLVLNFNSFGNLVLTAILDVNLTMTLNNQQTYMLYNGTFDLEQFIFDANFDFTRINRLNDQPGFPRDMAVDQNGAIYITGTDVRYPGAFRYSPFVWKFVPNGGAGSWFIPDISPQNRLNEGIDNVPTKITVSQNNDVFVSGITGVLLSNNTNAPTEFWQTKILANGTQNWLKNDITINAETDAMTVDASGNVYYGGGTANSLAALNTDSAKDIWFAKRSGASGDLLYVKQFHVAGEDILKSMVVDGAGNLFLAGQTRGLVQDIGSDDSFVMKFTQQRFPLTAPRITSVSPTTVNPGGLFRINGFNLSNTQAVFHNDKYLQFFINSSSEITATAPDGLNGIGNITISSGCFVTGFSLN